MNPLLCRLLLVLVALVMGSMQGVAALQTSSILKEKFQTTYHALERTLSVVTSPYGVDGEKSPFVFIDYNDIQSFSATGKHLLTRNMTGESALSFKNPRPVLNVDADNNLLLVAPLVNGSIIAIAVETFKTKWIYTPDTCHRHHHHKAAVCEHGALLHVDPLFSNCPSGAGGISILHCTKDSGFCFVSIVDINSGYECINPVMLPDSLYLGYGAQLNFSLKSFPSQSNQRKPMMVAMSLNKTIYGIDAATGHVVYAFGFNFPPDAPAVMTQTVEFAAGTSPMNNLFAIIYGSARHAFFQFYNLADGSLRSEKYLHFGHKEYEHCSLEWATLAWSPSNSEFGAITIANDSLVGRTLISVNAADGSVEISKYDHRCTNRFMNLDNKWLLCPTYFPAEIYAVCRVPSECQGQQDFTITMPSLPDGYSSWSGFEIFKTSTGSTGLLGHNLGSELNNPEINIGYIRAYDYTGSK